ncbi:MAG TPA: alpha/beta fold hydrolase [Xanthobacteraceae bacterium]|nr:alpha/beta fold hydrolase [Xanthobacteraceae bacterium]
MTQSRRIVIQSIGAGLATQLAAGEAGAQGEAKAQNEIWSGDYWANKGDVKLAMYRKRVGAPKAGEAPLPVLFLVHGSSISARSSFDLAVPGRGEYSVMNVFARHGFDVWTMDHENYGRSSRTSGNSDIASGVEDLKAGIEVVARETGRAKVHMMGESSGAIRAGAYAMARPDRVDRMVLSAFTYKGTGSPTLAKRAEQLAYFRTHNMRLRDRTMILSIATRDKPGTSEIEAMNALADAELKFGDQCPTGTYLDMTANLPLVDPKKVYAAVMLLRGEYDGIATVDDIYDFFKDLPNGDRQFVIVPGMAHSAVLATNRQLFWHAMHGFLTMPQPVAT